MLPSFIMKERQHSDSRMALLISRGKIQAALSLRKSIDSALLLAAPKAGGKGN
jgi:hypothetical protein